MTALIIILGILALILLLWVGVDLSFAGGVLSLLVKAGPFRIRVLPARARDPEAEAKKKQKRLARQKKKDAGKKPGQAAPKKKPDLDMILALVKMGLSALRRLRHRLDIDLIRLKLSLAGDDPYKTAMSYGYVCSALGVLLPLADAALDIKKKDMDVYCDFTSAQTAVDLRLVLTIHIWEIFYIGLAFLIEFLRWRRSSNKAQKAAKERNGSYGNTDRRHDGSGNGKDTGADRRQHRDRQPCNNA